MALLINKPVAVGLIAALVGIGSGGPLLADHHPYYFVGVSNNKHALYVNPGCGHGIDCGEWGNFCGAQFYSSQSSLDAGHNVINQGENIYIRENSSPYDVVCTVEPK